MKINNAVLTVAVVVVTMATDADGQKHTLAPTTETRDRGAHDRRLRTNRVRTVMVIYYDTIKE